MAIGVPECSVLAGDCVVLDQKMNVFAFASPLKSPRNLIVKSAIQARSQDILVAFSRANHKGIGTRALKLPKAEMEDVWGDDSSGEEKEGCHRQQELSRESDARMQQFYNVSVVVLARARALSSSSAHCMRRLFFCRFLPPLPKAGYREGLDEGKQLSVQEGFNAGACVCV